MRLISHCAAEDTRRWRRGASRKSRESCRMHSVQRYRELDSTCFLYKNDQLDKSNHQTIPAKMFAEATGVCKRLNSIAFANTNRGWHQRCLRRQFLNGMCTETTHSAHLSCGGVRMTKKTDARMPEPGKQSYQTMKL